MKHSFEVLYTAVGLDDRPNSVVYNAYNEEPIDVNDYQVTEIVVVSITRALYMREFEDLVEAVWFGIETPVMFYHLTFCWYPGVARTHPEVGTEWWEVH